jgi:hypothetical protein
MSALNTARHVATEALYPQYTISLRWEQDGAHDPGYPKWHEGLPEGRIWNYTVLNRMYREEQSVAELERWAREDFWPEYVAGKLADKNPAEPEITVKDDGRESWILDWFQHWTFDVGQTDAEALASFERYVGRYEHMQGDSRYWIERGEYRCLMGAEDRWRWSGGPSSEDRTDPPCRCEHCKAQGKIRIGH